MDISIHDFIDTLASSSPTPGGGGAAALGGAIGSSLGSMVGNLTVGKKKYESIQNKILSLLEDLTKNRQELLDCIQRDAASFLPLANAYRLPNNTEQEKIEKLRIMEDALYQACLVPLEIMKLSYDGILLLRQMGELGTKTAISDIAVGLQFLRSSLLSASVNVFINTRLMKNETSALHLNEKAQAIIDQAIPLADQLFQEITDTLITKKTIT